MRTGHRHHVLSGERLEQPVRSRTHQLQCAIGYQAGGNDLPNRQFGEVSGLAGRFDDAGHPGQKGRRELLEHAPHGKVERVDLHEGTQQRAQDVLDAESACLTQRFEVAVAQDVLVGQLFRALAGVHEQHADAAVDVDGRIASGGPRAQGEFGQLRNPSGQVLAERLECARPLLERHVAQRRPADGAGVVQDRRVVERLA